MENAVANDGDAVPAVQPAGDEKSFTVRTQEGKEFQVKMKILKMFGMIKEMLATLGDDDDKDDGIIPLTQGN